MSRKSQNTGVVAGGRIESADDYRHALEAFSLLEHAPMGTPATEQLQGLIDAILDYEARLGIGDRSDGTGSGKGVIVIKRLPEGHRCMPRSRRT